MTGATNNAARVVSVPIEAIEAQNLERFPQATTVTPAPASSSNNHNGEALPTAALAYNIVDPSLDRPQLNQQAVVAYLMANGGRIAPELHGMSANSIIMNDPELLDFLVNAQLNNPPPPEPPDYLAISLCSCLCCWVISLAALWESRLVHILYRRGEYNASYEASSRARVFALLAITIGSLLTLLGLFSMNNKHHRED